MLLVLRLTFLPPGVWPNGVRQDVLVTVWPSLVAILAVARLGDGPSGLAVCKLVAALCTPKLPVANLLLSRHRIETSLALVTPLSWWNIPERAAVHTVRTGKLPQTPTITHISLSHAVLYCRF